MTKQTRTIRTGSAATALALFLAALFAFAAPFFGKAFSSAPASAAVAAGTASVLNLDAEGNETQNFTDALQGKQNEYVYYGTNLQSSTANTPGYNNTHTGAIKWRVLSANDTKYGNGNVLLWADYMLGTGYYNAYASNPNYAYWNTSMIRAKLNGGTYYDAVSTTAPPTSTSTVSEADSWLYQLFGETERAGIAVTKTYETKLWGYASSASPRYSTTEIVGTGSGQYNSTNLGYAAAGTAQASGTSVIETTADSLFLLDYYDINTPDYGFAEADGSIYGSMVSSGWTVNSDGYPSYTDDTSAKASYLSFSNDIVSYYWLRPAGRNSTNNSYALLVR